MVVVSPLLREWQVNRLLEDDGLLLVLAKAPRLGLVKSRLAHGLGEQAALAAHERLVTHTLAATQAVPAHRVLLCDEPQHAQVRQWAERYQLPIGAQGLGDVGERMAHGFARFASEYERIVLIGADCPPINTAYVSQALQRLVDHDVVLGPAADGGYGLIGLRRAQPELFTGIQWSTDQVLTQTLAIAGSRGLRVALLEKIWDVDVEADWQRFLAAYPAPV